MRFSQSILLSSIVLSTNLLLGCFSTGVRSTGAQLPQASEEFGGNSVRITVQHNCSGGRCKNFSAKFENLLDEPLSIDASKATITRAGVTMPLASEDAKPGETIITIPPQSTVSTTFHPINKDTKKHLTYAYTTSVWGSVKVDDKCTKKSKIDQAEGKCAGLARYYYDRYISTGGWIKVSFPIKAQDWQKYELYDSIIPQFMGTKPNAALEANDNAPNWLSGSNETVFYKIECDENCVCKDKIKPRNFEIDDRFEPLAN